MKNLKNLKGVQVLNRENQKSITGGWDSGYCARLYLTHNCNHTNWVRCGFNPNDPSCYTVGWEVKNN
ncbi:hypothetical protein [Chryseobacterium elymi]|uniref:hypothetical protein n=1 Tax=Chryseobacterium elymi TaxID=395936 RepID=UPI000F505688|nr:hypothetical protein [Chryseobacterium elymi]